MKKKISILFLRPSLNLYGASKIATQLAHELHDRGHKIIFGSDNLDIFKEEIESIGITHYWLPLDPGKKNIFNFIRCFIKIFYITKKNRVDLIHSHHRWSSFVSFFISKIVGIPLVTTLHGNDKGNKMLTRFGDRIICVSVDGKRYLKEYFKIGESKITVIPNGIKIPRNNTKNPDNSLEIKLFNDSEIHIAHIARLSPEKDQETLFKAMRIIIKKYPYVKLLMIGKGKLENSLQNLARNLKINNNIKFLGELNDLSFIMHEIKFLVLSSLTEGLPISVLEAFAYGKPVIATNVGDIPKLVIDGYTGYLVPPKDYNALATAIEKVLEDTEKAKLMGNNGKNLVKMKYNFDEMVDNIEGEYYDLLKMKTSR
jgi:glycosyltransferase involved in cell wall biosynthesis